MKLNKLATPENMNRYGFLFKAAMVATALVSSVAWGDNISEEQARMVAHNFTAKDSALKACTIDKITKRGNLLIVSLKPNGYVAVSANDAADPIALFSTADFTEPTANSPFADMLRAIDTDIANATGDAYRAKWNKLLSTDRPTRTTATATATADTENEVKVSVPTAWQQCQPFNDFMPIEYASGNSINSIYRGRRFLGCVPTAYVQIMNYWKWPEVIDNDVSEELSIPAEKYDGVNPITSYTPRIKSGTALAWDDTQSQYPFDVSDDSGVSSGEYDLRGNFAEKKRLCIGRACLLSQIISKASLKTTGTGATLAQPTYNDWYETPVSIGHGSSGGNDGTNPDWYFGEVKKSLKAGIPLMVGIDVQQSDGWTGHAVVGTGWKYENDTHFFELNYGWGGGSAYHNYELIKAHLGSSISQRPKPKPVVVNQPDETAIPMVLNWHFPKKGWENELSGFKVFASEYGTTLEDKVDTFDTNPGTASGENPSSIFTGTYQGADNETAILVVRPEGTYETKTYYTWNEPKTLSANSSLSFRLRANDTRGIAVILQTNVNGAGWQDTYAFKRYDQCVANWHTVTIPLTGLANSSIRFRLFVEKIASMSQQWKDSDPIGYMIDDFTVTKVESMDVANPIEVASVDDPNARSVTIEQGLNVGTKYALRISPVFTEGTAIDSDYIPIKIVDIPMESPKFTTIASVPKNANAPSVLEGCFRECSLGRNYLLVEGSSTMTSLKAYSSHISILPDAKINVQGIPNSANRFLVSIDGSDIDSLGGRQRIILTLVGANEYGEKVQKDLTLRFSSETASENEVQPSDLVESGGDEQGEEEEPSEEDEPDEPTEESPVIATTFPIAADAGPNDDLTAKTRFCPGVTKTGGWYDVNRTQTYNYLPPAPIDLVLWWVDRYKAANNNSSPAGYAEIDDSEMPTSDSGLTFIGYLDSLLSWCENKASYFPSAMTEVANWTGNSEKLKSVGRQIYNNLANGPIAFKVYNSTTYYGVIWGCDYVIDDTGNYAQYIYFTCSKSKNDKLLRYQLKLGDMNNETANGDLMIPSYASYMNGMIGAFYPISGPMPTASDGEVTVKVTAGGKVFDISKAFSKVEKGSGNAITYTLDPTPNKRIEVGGEQISIQPEFANGEDETPFSVQDGKLIFKVRSIPGLKYQVLSADSLNGEFTPAGKEREAISTRRELTVQRSGETSGFYKVQVSR